MVLKDSYGRPLLNLRIAITAKCNLRCSYCHGEGEEKSRRRNIREMTSNEIIRFAKIAVGLGVSRIKLTGGEPLACSEIDEIVGGISRIPGVEDLSITTNGTLLAAVAEKLYSNGLKRVNVSLPTLDEGIYSKLTGGRVQDALKGIMTAVEVGFNPVKLNMLILKGENENEVPRMIEFAAQSGTVLQLIELESINVTAKYYLERHIVLDDYEMLLKHKALKVETRRYMQNRHVYHLPNAKVEVIRPLENSEFCQHCTRLRLTSDGRLKPCLMRNDNLVDILTPTRNGATDQELIKLFTMANKERQPYQTSCYLMGS